MRLGARKRACLDAIGIEVWRARADDRGPGGGPPAVTAQASGDESPERTGRSSAPEPRTSHAASLPAGPVAPPAGREDGAAGIPEPLSTAPDRIGSLGWDGLRETVAGCTACGLHEVRTQTVFGVGDTDADLMIIGEAPGADEDRQGEPFVGRAGQLLNAMLEAIGLARQQVYIANIIKCRPPGNRDPHAEEAAACQPFLHRQIALIRPRLILSVGRISAHNLLGTEEPVGRLRGRVHRFEPGDIPLIVTYHPAYLLRRPQEKAKAWQDLQAAHRLLHDAGAGLPPAR